MTEIKLAERCTVLYDGKLCAAVTTNVRDDFFDAHFINPDTGKWDMMYNIPVDKFRKA